MVTASDVLERLCEAIDFLGGLCYCGGELAGRVGGEARVWQRIEDELWQPDGVTLAEIMTRRVTPPSER